MGSKNTISATSALKSLSEASKRVIMNSCKHNKIAES